VTDPTEQLQARDEPFQVSAEPDSTRGAQVQAEEYQESPTRESLIRKKSSSRVKRAPAKPKETTATLDISTIVPLDRQEDPDMRSPQQCREFLASLSKRDVEQMNLPAGDDWKTVKASRSKEFTDRIYRAILVHPARVPPYGPQLDAEQLRRLTDKQDDTLKKLHIRLQSKYGKNVADAQAQLLFDTAMNLHEHGVSPSLVEEAKADKAKANGAAFIPRSLDVVKCSDRLNMIVNIIENHKLVAKDVMDGINLGKIAQNPRGFLVTKIGYHQSNSKRQGRLDEVKAGVKARKAEDKAKSTKRKRQAEEEDDVEDQAISDAEVPPAADVEGDAGTDEDAYVPSPPAKKKRRATKRGGRV
jgi:hypothetical protein